MPHLVELAPARSAGYAAQIPLKSTFDNTVLGFSHIYNVSCSPMMALR